MITACNWPPLENGIEIFTFGEMLAERSESAIAALVADESWEVPADSDVSIVEKDLIGDYLAHLKGVLPLRPSLGIPRVFVDCANGAAGRVAPRLFRDLDLPVETLNSSGKGERINAHFPGCEELRALLRTTDAGLGLALDGDADRLLLVDRHGTLLSSDVVIFLCAMHLKRRGRLKKDMLAISGATNLGLERSLFKAGIGVIRCGQDERQILETITANDLSLGGDGLGRLIFADHARTGDGLITALMLLEAMGEGGLDINDPGRGLQLFSDIMVNARVARKSELRSIPELDEMISRVQRELAGRGRVILRYASSDPLLRVVVEAEDLAQAERGAAAIRDTAARVLGSDDKPEEDPILETSLYVALAMVDGRIRAVSVEADGTYSFLDPLENWHHVLFVSGRESLDLAAAVEEFEALLNSPRAKEVDLQRFFEGHPGFILTDDYRSARPHLLLESATNDRGPLIPDFVLEPVERSGLADLLEIKLPSARVLVLKQSRLRFSASVVEACAQLREYSAFFDDQSNRFAVQEKYGLTAYRPRLFVIIGRRAKADPLEVRRVYDDLPRRIEIRTYDDLLEKMQARLKQLRG